MPSDIGGDSTDVMVLAERKEALDRFIKEVSSQIDCFLYGPLADFIGLWRHLTPFLLQLRKIQRHVRKYLCRLQINTVIHSAAVMCLSMSL